MGREWHSIERMQAVPFNPEKIADERETTGELTIIKEAPPTVSNKPEAIVRPLRRRKPSDDDNQPPDLQDLEAQIIDKLTKLDKPQKAQRDSLKEFDKKPYRSSQSRESKKSSKDVSSVNIRGVKFVTENWKINDSFFFRSCVSKLIK